MFRFAQHDNQVEMSDSARIKPVCYLV